MDVEVTIVRSSPPEVEVASVWDATEEPFKEVMVPPAPPASTPQVKVPFAQRSFSVEVLQAERDAPKRDATVRPPVEDAAVKERLVAVSEEAVVVAKVVVPRTLKRSEVVKLEVEAFVSVVFPVTLRVEEKLPVDPTSAP